MNNTIAAPDAPAAIRTFVPLVVGYILQLGVTKWLEVDTNQITAFITALLAYLYWALIKVLEKKWPGAGILLGYAGSPVAYATRPDELVAVHPDTVMVTPQQPGEFR